MENKETNDGSPQQQSLLLEEKKKNPPRRTEVQSTRPAVNNKAQHIICKRKYHGHCGLLPSYQPGGEPDDGVDSVVARCSWNAGGREGAVWSVSNSSPDLTTNDSYQNRALHATRPRSASCGCDGSIDRVGTLDSVEVLWLVVPFLACLNCSVTWLLAERGWIGKGGLYLMRIFGY